MKYRYITDTLNMLQPVYVFMIFVLKRNVINVILGRDIKKRKTITAKSKETEMSKRSIIKSRQRRSSGGTNHSNRAFSISIDKDTVDSSVVLMSAQPYEDVPLKLPSQDNRMDFRD